MNRLDRSLTRAEIIDLVQKIWVVVVAQAAMEAIRSFNAASAAVHTVVSRQKGTETDGRRENERIMSPAPSDCTKFRVKADKG